MTSPELAALRYRGAPEPEAGEFPFAIPCIRTLGRVELTHQVTLLVGENGSGKSTFLEALAVACSLPAVGSASVADDPTLDGQRRLARRLALTWRGRTRRGFFLRAEDFFGFQKELAKRRVEHEAELARVGVELAGASALARRLARGTHLTSIGAMERTYGSDPDAKSHGEAFLDLFRERLAPGGLYLLDEPEAALSPQSQLGFISMLGRAVDEGSQFIIATHSPLIMAIPETEILSFDTAPISTARYDELTSVSLVRDFLNAPERYMRRLWR